MSYFQNRRSLIILLAAFGLSSVFQNCSPMTANFSPLSQAVLASSQLSVVLATTISSPTNQSVIPISLTIGQAVSGLDLTKVVVTNGSASSLVGSGANYTFNVTPASAGTVTVSFPAGAFQDSAGDASAASNVLSVVYDPGPPTVTLSSTVSGVTGTSPIPVSIVFSKAVNGLSLSGFTATNAVVSSLTGTGANYSVNVSPIGLGLVTLTLNYGAATDSAGNYNIASNKLSWTFNNLSPTVTLSSSLSGATNLSSVPISISFSESVTGFNSASISLVNATLTSFNGSGSSYSITVSPISQGNLSVMVPAGAAMDSAGNRSLQSNTFSITYDTVSPSATLSSTSSSPTNLSSIPVKLVFSENIKQFSLSNLSLTNATASGLAGSGSTYTFNIIPTNQGSVSVTLPSGAVTDLAGNGNTASNTLNRVFDSVSPTVTLSASVSSPTTQSSFTVNVAFSENVTGFSLGGVIITNGTASSLSGSGSAYSFTVTASAPGNIGIAVKVGAAMDASGNPNTVSSTLNTDYEPYTPVTATLSTTASSPTNLTSIPVTLTFSAKVSGFSLSSGLSLVNATATGLSGSGMNYTFNLIPSQSGIFSAQVVAGAAQTSSGQVNVASNTLSLTYTPLVSFPKGAYAIWESSNSLSGVFNGDSGIVGILLEQDWNSIESAKDTYDFSQLDARITEARAANLAVELLVRDAASLAPSWILNSGSVQLLTFNIGQTSDPNSNCILSTGPVFWDPTFHRARLDLIAALGARYSQNSSIVGVMTSFANWQSGDWSFPEGSNHCSSGVDSGKLWLKAGYSDAKMLQVAQDIMNATASAFPNQILKLPILYDTTELEGNNGFQLVEEAITYGNGASWSGRFYVQEDDLTTVTPLGTSSKVTGANEGGSQRGYYLLKLLAQQGTRSGHQLADAATAGLSGDCTENGGNTPCTDVTGILQTASNIGISYAPAFIEYYSSDATYTSAYSVFTSTTSALGGTPRQ